MALVRDLDYIDEGFQKVERGEKKHVKIWIAGKLYAWINKGQSCVQLREVFRKNGQQHPSKFKGIVLPCSQWNELRSYAPLLKEQHEGLKDVEPCNLVTGHQNRLSSWYECTECNPFGMEIDEENTIEIDEPISTLITPCPATPPPFRIKRAKAIPNFE